MALLTIEDPRWSEFLDKLYDAMDWQEGETVAQTTWTCGTADDRLGLAKEVATAMGFDGVDFGDRHVCCDCEIIFNLDERPEDA